MTKFDPHKLTTDIPDDVKLDTQQQSLDDFIADAADGSAEGQLALLSSFAASLAMQFQNIASHIAHNGQDGQAVELKRIFDALEPAAQTIAVQAAAHALGMAHAKILAEASAKHGPAAIMHSMAGSQYAAEIAANVVPQVISAIHVVQKLDKSENVQTHDIGEAHLFIRPQRKDKP